LGEAIEGEVKIIAVIEKPAVINKILEHLGLSRERAVNRLARGPPGKIQD